MRINNIVCNNLIKNAPQNHINKQNSLNIGQQVQNSTVNPHYYQALNKISFKSAQKPIQYSIQDGKHGKEMHTYSKFGPLTLDDFTLDYYILNPDKSVNEDKLKDFINIYNGFYEEMQAEADEEISFFQSTLDEISSGIIQFPTPDEYFRQTVIESLSSHVSEKTFTKNVLSHISGDEKKELTEKLLSITQQKKSEIMNKAIRRTERIFELSQTADGSIDLSDLDRKKMLSDMIEYYEYNFNGDDSVAELQKYAKKADGTIDIDIAAGTMDLLSSSDIKYSVEEIASVVKHFYDKDPDSKEEILKTLKSLDKSDFSYSRHNSYLSDLTEMCFDKNNKFNPQKRDIILELVKAAGEWTDDSMEKFDSYPTYVQNAFKFISDYLEEQGENIFAGNGDLSKNFRKYIDYRMHNIVIL